jgi:hypothetical protein
MTITMGPRTDITDPENMQSSYEPYGSPGKGGFGLWLAILALVAVIVLALAAALGAFDGSSDSDGITVESVDPRLDSDFHRTPAAQVPSVAVEPVTHPQAWEELATSSAAPEPAPSPQAYEEFAGSSSETDYVDPREDVDRHREP